MLANIFRNKNSDTLDMEFQYYSSLLKDLVLMLPNQRDQKVASMWFRKLSDPAYNAEVLREKRNQYLLMLTISMSLNSLNYPFDNYPPDGSLTNVLCIGNPKKASACPNPRCPPTNNTKETSQKCDLHDEKCPTDDKNIGKVLDEQFNFLINLCKSYVSQLSDPSDRRRGRKWIQYLSSIDSTCFDMKGVRNDYTMLLSGYALNDELPGPFIQLPIHKIVPLQDLVKIMDMQNHMIFDPSHPKTLKFFREVPQPQEGAFAFIAISGQICDWFLRKN